MMPFYRYTDPSSYQMPVKQVPLMHYHVPRTEAVPVPIGDQSESARVYQHWPYYGHNIPYYYNYYSAPCHSCFNHGNYPCNSYGYHPPVPETIPVQYVYPPPYLLQQPIYDYQRGFPRDYHCCGCSNYTHDQIQRDGSRVKVEEQATDADKGRDSLVPLGSSNNAFPVVLIPNDQTKNKEKIKPMEKDVDSEDRAPRPRDMEPSKDLKQSEREQRVSNGWIPFDVEGLKSLMMMGEDGNQNEVNGNKPGQFPFPIIWLPSFNNKQDVAAKAEDHRTEDYAQQTSEHSSPAQRLFPVKLPDNGNSPIESQGVKESHNGKAGSETKEKKTDHVQIPVKQMDQHGEKICPVYVDDIRNEDDHVGGKASGTSSRRQSSSPKSSKLPPVCLRVDPLTKKKNGIGTSRSPSPPKSKSFASELSLRNDQDLQGGSPSTDEKEVDTKRKEINVLKVVDGRKRGKGDDDGKAGSGTHIPVLVLADEDNIPTKEDIPSKEVDYCAVEDRDTNETTVSATSTVNGEVRKKLSNEEASLLIQSAYRGYDVRRWEPLKKLKQIANVREEVAGVRNWIHALESPDFREDDKQILVVGEMIMGLLLKLDTVQGLHPSLRDFRKSLARELVSLQEKLDSLKVEKSKKMAKDRPCARHELDAGDTVNLGVWRNIQTGEQPGCDSSKDQGGEIPNPLHADDDLIIFEDGSRDAKAIADVAASTEEANTDGCLGEFSSGEVLVTDNQHGGCVLSGAEQVLKASADCSSVQDVEGTILLGKSGGHSWDGQGKDDDGVAKYVYMENYELKKLPQGSIDQNFEQLKPSEMERTELIPIGETNPALDKQIDKILEDPAAIDKEENVETETSVLTRWRQVEQNLLTDLASPATAVGRLETDQEISKEILIAELLRGEHDMDEQIKCEMPGKQEQEVLYYNDAASSVKVVPIFDKVEEHPIDVLNGSSFIDEMKDHAELELETADERLEAPKHVEVPAFVEVKEQPVEVLKGNIFGDEVIDCKEVGTEDVHEDPEYAMPEEAVQEAELVEVDQEDKHLVDFEPEKMLQHMPERQEETGGETRVGGNDNVEMQNDSQVKEPLSGEEVHIADKPVVNSEDADWIQKGQQHQVEMVSRNGNNWENYPSGSENKEKEMKFPSNIIMNAKDVVTKETALSTTVSSIGRQLSVDDEKLVEENRRLREMMEKLMEAGQQQLTVISNLTGRVKDLETKLSQKRRGKARRCRTATLKNNRAVKV